MECEKHDNEYDNNDFCRYCRDELLDKIDYQLERIEKNKIKLTRMRERLQQLTYDNKQTEVYIIKEEFELWRVTK